MSDIPNKFGLETGQLQRTDTPFIPRDVIREAVANALMHRDYRSHQPTQIIRYSNRLEFKNAGYSLKPIEDFYQSGSKPRNSLIAGVFHELKHAETKGTGIRSMRKWMQEAGLSTPPIMESSRDNNQFDLILLPHHLLDHEVMKWLSQFKNVELSDAQRRALAFTRKVGAITNQDYRQLNGSDTLAASAALRGLRDAELLTQKGKGNGTYYKLGIKASEKAWSPTGYKAEDLDVNSGDKDEVFLKMGLDAIPEGFPELLSALRDKLLDIGHRHPNPEEVKSIIKELCSLAALTKTELANILHRTEEYIRKYYLSKMVQSKELVYLFDDSTHPKQAYKAVVEK